MEAFSEGAAPVEGERVPPAAGLSALVPDWLHQREVERREEAEKRRRERDAQSVLEEQSDFFTASFAREREAIEALLWSEPAQDAEADAESVSEAARRLQDLQRLLTDSVRFLAPYEVRQAQAALSKLQGALSERRLQLKPKKRFAFTKALKKDTPFAPSKPPAQHPPPESSAKDQKEAATSAPLDPSCGFSRAEGRTLELGPTDLLQQDVVLSHLRRCRVLLRGNPNTLLVLDCHDCTILCGPVSTSARVDGCSGCLVALACQQLRTHRATETSFYVQVTSRAMLEDCSAVRFAPYSWDYPGMDADFKTAGLDRSKNNWDQVDDFNWLAKNQASPNWCVIPEKERITDWN
ncbi:tubulin-specific chaperone C [Thamnophis elegans]|uniref:tubulin-specific chaperone C n=1 Tax=Thamnophis elegans TaxID=35005 RepID=UPI0013777BA5|nr:tubulin-specific chaperone C [Thamnophis elegans]